jgi:hypothetical protein
MSCMNVHMKCTYVIHMNNVHLKCTLNMYNVYVLNVHLICTFNNVHVICTYSMYIHEGHVQDVDELLSIDKFRGVPAGKSA